MKEKYIDEKFPSWFIFGEDKINDKYDVADRHGDVFCGISKKSADKLVLLREKFCKELIDIIQEDTLIYKGIQQGTR